MRRGTVILALAFSLAFIFSAIIVPAPARGELTQIELVPGKYTGTNIYVPGETMEIIIHGNLPGERFNIYEAINEEGLLQDGDITIPESGTVKLTLLIPDVSADGNYYIRARLPNGDLVLDVEEEFWIQGYSFNIETDRDAYLSGENIKVFWTANNLKDQTLPVSGEGRIRVWRQSPTDPADIEQILSTHVFNTSAGSASFVLPTGLDRTMNYFVDGWFNDTAYSPRRIQYSKANFKINELGTMIELDKNQYTAGSLLRMTVQAVATENAENPSYQDPGVPDCDVSITIRMVGAVNPTEDKIYLKTDSHGLVEHIVQLNDVDYVDGAVFDVDVYAQKGENTFSDSATFQIASTSSISVVLDFNKAQYASGEHLFLNATASSIGDVENSRFTYILEIRDSVANGSLLARDTQEHGNFSFQISSNFEGWLWVRVTADDGAGNSASVVQQVSVAYAIVLVNVNNENYNAGDEITVMYEVIHTFTSEPVTFYIVYDKEGSIVEEGPAADGTFTFRVPDAPSSRYDFTVFASALGRVISGTDSAYLFSGYVLTLDFNRAVYGPGNTMEVDYRIIVMGNADMPATFTITFGLINGPQASLQTGERTGSLLYTIPDDIDQGDQIFTANCDFGASASEVIVVKDGANLLWYLTISDIPIFSLFLLFLTLMTFYFSYRTRKRIKRMEKDGLIRSGGEAAAPIRRSQESGNQVECKECGNPIEITTTRRPIEVMCPHCGEIQHIE